MRVTPPILLSVVLAVAGCERPFVDPTPPQIEVVSPNLDEVQGEPTLRLELRVTSFRTVDRVELDDEALALNPSTGLYEATRSLVEGLNAFRLVAVDIEGTELVDTLYAFHFPGVTSLLTAAVLPSPLANHAATRLPDGRVLLLGGVGASGQVRTDAIAIREQGAGTYIVTEAGTLEVARAGHTATLLPDGRVVVVGGARQAEANEVGDLVETAEVFSPASGTSETLPLRGPPIGRTEHAATFLQREGRLFVYLYGGRGRLSGGSFGTRSDLTVLEFRATSSGDSLVNLSPEGGIGALAPVAEHVLVPLPPDDDAARLLAAGTYTAPGSPASPVAARLRFRPSSFFFPFEVLEEPVSPLLVARTGHAATPFLSSNALVAGGRSPDGTPLSSLEVFADEVGRFFRFPTDDVALRVARHSHTATLLPSGRILLAGGVDALGRPLSSLELFLRRE